MMRESKYKIKIVYGYRRDQSHTIDANEAHKAYYLFLNPEKRSVFSDGFPISGKEIKQIEPDYNATLGWNPDHELRGDDWNYVRSNGVDRKLRGIMALAKEMAVKADLNDLSLPLLQLARGKYASLPSAAPFQLELNSPKIEDRALAELEDDKSIE